MARTLAETLLSRKSQTKDQALAGPFRALLPLLMSSQSFLGPKMSHQGTRGFGKYREGSRGQVLRRQPHFFG